MTTAEVNAAIAKKKGWRWRGPTACKKYQFLDEYGGYHPNPIDDPREWANLLEEMLADESISVVITSRSFEVGWTRNGVRELFGGDLNITATATGEAVCRAWLVWKKPVK